MMTRTIDFGPSFKTLAGDDGIAERVFGLAGGMPTLDLQATRLFDLPKLNFHDPRFHL